VVVDEVANPQDEIELSKARKIKPDANVGDAIEVEVTPKNFGRHRGADRKTSDDASGFARPRKK
jgi:hypothetical protein